MNYIDNNKKFNHAKWQRDQILNEGPYNDPALKSLRLRIPGEEFPDVSKWWEYEPEDIIRYVYWHQGQLPPTGPKMEKEWDNLVKQLHVKYPIPADAEGHLDMSTVGESAVNEAGGTGVFEPGDMYSDDFDYVGMLEWGANAPDITFDNIGTMRDASESFTDVNYHREGADLGNAIEWFEDTGPGEPRVEDFMKRFRAACAKTLEDIKR